MIERRRFGQTALEVPLLGYGAGPVGDARIPEAEAARLLNAVVDAGLSLIDTAPSYGISEERIGRHLAGRRDEIVLSTKVGYGIPGMPDWTHDTVIAGVEAARRRLRTDWIDIVHLHSCPLEVLRDAGVLDALGETVERGWARVAAYSGENEALGHAIDSGAIGGVQCSVNVFDQRGLVRLLPRARTRGLGVIGKRPLGNAPWRFEARPDAPDVAVYWARWRAMGLAVDAETAIRFAAFCGVVDSCIVGTTDLDHLRADIDAVRRGPLPDDTMAAIRDAFRRHDDGWTGLI